MTADEQLLFSPEHAADKLEIGRTRMYALLKSGETEVSQDRTLPPHSRRRAAGLRHQAGR